MGRDEKKGTLKKKFFVIKRITFCIALLLMFFFGYFFGTTQNYFLETNIVREENEIIDLTKKIEFFESFGVQNCEEEILDILSNQMYEFGVNLNNFENENKDKFDDRYLLLKKKYTSLQIIILSLFKNFEEKCDIEKDVIIFFFDESDLSKKQGQVLDKVQLENNILILPMHYNYSSDFDFFYNFFNVEKTPSLIINFNLSKNGFLEKNEILEILSK